MHKKSAVKIGTLEVYISITNRLWFYSKYYIKDTIARINVYSVSRKRHTAN